MPKPQAGIFAASGPDHCFLEYSVPQHVPKELIARTLRAVHDEITAGGDIQLVMGFSHSLWSVLSSRGAPTRLKPFRSIKGRNGKFVPGTQNDLWLWLGGRGRDRLFAASMQANRLLNEHATLRLEQQAFQYLDSRDLTGFIDGTANPEGEEALEAALIADGESGAGGSYLIAMRWVHDLAAFHSLSVADQERIMGRRKEDSEELTAAEKPKTAHISRVEIEQDGEELAIFRRSVPFGNLDQHGLYFLAFSTDPERFELMLSRMYGLTEDGIEDRLTDYSRPTAAAYYFAPHQEALAEALGSV